MLKRFLILSLITMGFIGANIADAKNAGNPNLTEAIKLYKAGNYSQCYVVLEDVLQKDPSNALACYYMAITSAQIGRREEAISHYERVLTLSPQNNNLSRYARKGKLCLEEPDKCNESSYGSEADEFIQKKVGEKFAEEVKSDFEKLKLENMMREMNRANSVEQKRFKEFKDFSSELPTDEDVVMALRILQRAGFGDFIANRNNNLVDLSTFSGESQYGSIYGLMGNSSMNPQLLQTLLTNSITQGF